MNGLTPLFDDLTDEQQWDSDDLKQLFTAPFPPENLSGSALTCRHLFEQGGFEWNEYWESVFQAQMNSKKQLGKIRLTENELSAITFQKGGASVVLGWHIIGDESGGTAMKSLAYHFGAYAQLVNDIFDIWKDREGGIQTLATCEKNFYRLSETHQFMQRQVTAAIDELNISLPRKRRLVGSLTPLFCLADLATERLVKLQTEYGDELEVANCTRKELVCDMAEWSNRLRWCWLMLTK